MSVIHSIPRSALDIDSARNHRSQMDPDRLEELERSIRENGLTTAVTVRHIEGTERFQLVAGHRRLTALDAIHGADEYTIPAIVVDGEQDIVALVENLVREDVSAYDEAVAFNKLIEAGHTPLGVAQKIGIDVRRVTTRLELLKLPEGVQALYADDKLPPGGVKPLLSVARKNEALAVAVAKLAASSQAKSQLLPKRIDLLLREVADKDARFKLFPISMMPADWWKYLSLHGMQDDATVQDLIKRMNALSKDQSTRLGGRNLFDQLTNKALIPLDADQALGIIYEPAFLVDPLIAVVKEREAYRAQQARYQLEQKARRTGLPPEAGEDEKERHRAKMRKHRALLAERARQARGYNLSLGAELIRDAPSIDRDDAVRLVCMELIHALALGKVARAGLRLVLDAWQTEETITSANGPARRKVTYLTNLSDCEEAAQKFLNSAKTADELLQRTLILLLSAQGALQSAVSESSQQFPGLAMECVDLRQKLVLPFVSKGEHTKRLKTQWKAQASGHTDEHPKPEVGTPTPDTPPDAA